MGLSQLMEVASVGRGVLPRQAAPSDWAAAGRQVQAEQRGQSTRCLFQAEGRIVVGQASCASE